MSLCEAKGMGITMKQMFKESINGKILINIQCFSVEQCLEARERYGNVFLTGVTAKSFPELEDGILTIRALQEKGIRVSAGLGDGASSQWERALKLALSCNTEHLNQVFPAAALSQRLIDEKGNHTIANALIRPTGRVGYVQIGTGPMSEKEEAVVPIRAAAAMLKETHVKSLKFFPVKGLQYLEDLEEAARVAGEFDMMIEPTGGITPDNVEIIVRTCLRAGAKYVMPHLYGSLKDEKGKLDFEKMDKAIAAIKRA